MIAIEDMVIGNAGGMVKTLADVERLCKTPATRITVGSITTLGRRGNEPVAPGDVYFYDPETQESGNSLGLPNMGLAKYFNILAQMVTLAHAHGKELWASVNGETFDDILALVRACSACGVDGVEINLACPNVHDKGKTKPLLCQDLDAVRRILSGLLERVTGTTIAVKIAPIDDYHYLSDLASVIVETKIVRQVIATNTLGGQRFVRNGADMIAFRPPGSKKIVNVGGQAGKPLHKLAVKVAGTMAEFLGPKRTVVGVGGVFTGRDALDFLEVGCIGFECATAIMAHSEGVLKGIVNELGELLPSAA